MLREWYWTMRSGRTLRAGLERCPTQGAPRAAPPSAAGCRGLCGRPPTYDGQLALRGVLPHVELVPASNGQHVGTEVESQRGDGLAWSRAGRRQEGEEQSLGRMQRALLASPRLHGCLRCRGAEPTHRVSPPHCLLPCAHQRCVVRCTAPCRRPTAGPRDPGCHWPAGWACAGGSAPPRGCGGAPTARAPAGQWRSMSASRCDRRCRRGGRRSAGQQ